METVGTLVALLASLLYALVSGRLERWWLSMPMVMVFAGVAVGPLGMGLIELDPRSELIRLVAEITLSLMLFHDAVRIDLGALRAGYRIPLRLLAIGLPAMIAVGTLSAMALMPELGIVGAALIATMLAPTDAALGESVVSDKRIPVAVRQGLNVESGLNDGLSVPVFIVLLAVAVEPSGWESGGLLTELVQQIGLGVFGGILVGGGGGLAFRAAKARGLILKPWRPLAIMAAALGCFSAAAVMGGSGFIAAFVGGVLFGITSGARTSEDTRYTATTGLFFDAMSFLLVGAVLLPAAKGALTPAVVLYAVLSLVVVRMVSVALASIGSRLRAQTVVFMGWFGPRGLATVVFTMLLLEENIEGGTTIAATAVVGVILSVVAHGLSAPPLVARYARWWQSVAPSSPDAPEAEGVHEHATPARVGAHT